MKIHGGKLNDATIRIAVLGAGGVGKSALVVRYLTRRFIWDYDPTLESIYQRNAIIDGHAVSLQILDTAAAQEMESEETERQVEAQMMWADAVLLVYSVTDRSSFQLVLSLCHRVTCHSGVDVPTHQHLHCADTSRLSQHSPAVVIVGNKADLYAGRCVGTVEAADKVVDAACCLETSAMEGGPQISAAFETLCRLVIARRTSSVSPPGELTSSCGSRRRRSIDECKRRFLRQQLLLAQAVDKLKRRLNRSADYERPKPSD